MHSVSAMETALCHCCASGRVPNGAGGHSVGSPSPDSSLQPCPMAPTFLCSVGWCWAGDAQSPEAPPLLLCPASTSSALLLAGDGLCSPCLCFKPFGTGCKPHGSGHKSRVLAWCRQLRATQKQLLMGSIGVCQGEQQFSPTGTDTGQRNAGVASLLHGQARLASALPLFPAASVGPGAAKGALTPAPPTNGGKASCKPYVPRPVPHHHTLQVCWPRNVCCFSSSPWTRERKVTRKRTKGKRE